MLLPPERRRRPLDIRIAAAYLAGTVSGAAVTATVLWMLSGFAEPLGNRARMGLLVAAAIFVWLCKRGPLAGVISLPESRRQIPATVFGGRLWAGAWRFGFELATGVRTYLPSTAPYVLLLAMILTRPTLALALLMGLGFGVARAVPVMLQFAPRAARHPRMRLRGGEAAASFAVLIGGLALV